jgi:hypothetical protein
MQFRNSSELTQKWLKEILSRIRRVIPAVTANMTPHWVSLRSPQRRKNFAYLNVQRRKIRVFVALHPTLDKALEKTKATSDWGTNWPSIFYVRDPRDVEKACTFIEASFEKITAAKHGKKISRPIRTLDDLGLHGSLQNRLQTANLLMGHKKRRVVTAIIRRTLRQDTALVKLLKKAARYQCQFPGCRARVMTRGGTSYVEVAHIRPFASGGKSVIGNLLVLCPNHHKEFDLGVLKIIEQTVSTFTGVLNGKTFSIKLGLN